MRKTALRIGFLSFVLIAAPAVAQDDSQYYYPDLIDMILNGKLGLAISKAWELQSPTPDQVQQRTMADITVGEYITGIRDQCGDFVPPFDEVRTTRLLGEIGGLIVEEFKDPSLGVNFGQYEGRIKEDTKTYVRVNGGCDAKPVHDLEDELNRALEQIPAPQ